MMITELATVLTLLSTHLHHTCFLLITSSKHLQFRETRRRLFSQHQVKIN